MVCVLLCDGLAIVSDVWCRVSDHVEEDSAVLSAQTSADSADEDNTSPSAAAASAAGVEASEASQSGDNADIRHLTGLPTARQSSLTEPTAFFASCLFVSVTSKQNIVLQVIQI